MSLTRSRLAPKLQDSGTQPCNLGAKRDRVRDIRKTNHAKKILPKDYWRYL